MPSRARLANDAWEALLGAHATLLRRLSSADVFGSLSMREYDVLYTLSKCSSPIRLGELNQHVLLSQPALSRLVERLVRASLITRADDAHDGRGIRLSLTPDGIAAQRRIGRRHAQHVARELSALSAAELEQLRVLCERLAGVPSGDQRAGEQCRPAPRLAPPAPDRTRFEAGV